MSNVLPSDVDRWDISDGSMTEKQLLLHPGGCAMCTLEKTELAYIPQAFQVRARHNANIDWKKPKLFATIDIEYEFLFKGHSFCCSKQYIPIRPHIVWADWPRYN